MLLGNAELIPPFFKTVYGDEVKFGGGSCYLTRGPKVAHLICFLTGKTIREGMGQTTGLSFKDALDLVITNALIVDWSGIYKVRRR